MDYRIEDLSKTEKKVIFMIDEGDKVKIESITFTGNANVSAQTLRNAMKKTKVAVFWRILSDNTVYSQANYEADVESIKAVYQARGLQGHRRQGPDPRRLRRRSRRTKPEEDQAAGQDHDPDRRGRQVLHERDPDRRRAAERAADGDGRSDGRLRAERS